MIALFFLQTRDIMISDFLIDIQKNIKLGKVLYKDDHGYLYLLKKA